MTMQVLAFDDGSESPSPGQVPAFLGDGSGRVTSLSAITFHAVDYILDGITPINPATCGLDITANLPGAANPIPDGTRVLVPYSFTVSGAGIYIAHSGPWERAADWPDGMVIVQGTHGIGIAPATNAVSSVPQTSLFSGQMLVLPIVAGALEGTVGTDEFLWGTYAIPVGIFTAPWGDGSYGWFFGQQSGDLTFVDLSGMRLREVADPVDPSDGVTLNYLNAGPKAFQTVTSPPVSTTVYQNTSGVHWQASLSFTLAPSVSVAADVKVELSPDGSTWTTWTDPSMPVGASAVSGAEESVEFPVPAGWRYRITGTHASLVSLVAIG